MGSHIPPRKALQDRWAEFQAGANSPPLQNALALFNANRSPTTLLTPVLNGPHSLVAGASPPSFEPLELGSQVFRMAHRVSRRYTITAAKNQLEVSISGESTLAFAKPVPSATLPSHVENQADDEMRGQEDDPELFMLWAAKDGLLESNPNPLTWTGLVSDVFLLALAWPVFEAKAESKVQRPYDLNSSIKPVLRRPGHSSWPGGHAFVGGVMAVLIAHWANPNLVSPLSLQAAAKRIAFNRERGGLHSAQDSLVGYEMGVALALELIDFLHLSGSGTGWSQHLLLALRYAKKEWTP